MTSTVPSRASHNVLKPSASRFSTCWLDVIPGGPLSSAQAVADSANMPANAAHRSLELGAEAKTVACSRRSAGIERKDSAGAWVTPVSGRLNSGSYFLSEPQRFFRTSTILPNFNDSSELQRSLPRSPAVRCAKAKPVLVPEVTRALPGSLQPLADRAPARGGPAAANRGVPLRVGPTRAARAWRRGAPATSVEASANALGVGFARRPAVPRSSCEAPPRANVLARGRHLGRGVGSYRQSAARRRALDGAARRAVRG